MEGSLGTRVSVPETSEPSVSEGNKAMYGCEKA